MESSNPVFKKGYAAMGNPGSIANRPEPTTEELNELYNAPAASSTRTGRMTIDDVVTRTSILFIVLVVTGAFAWRSNLSMGVALGAMIGAMVLGMILTFSQKVRPGFAIAYAALEGLALGTISSVYESRYPGIVSQAVIGTIAAFAGILFAYKNKKIRVTPKFTRIMSGAMSGYLIVAFGSLIASFAGVGHGLGFYGVSGIGLLLCVGGVGIAAFFLVMDFDQITKMIAAGAPHEESWRAGFGLMVTVVWLYLEILRLLSVLRDSNN